MTIKFFKRYISFLVLCLTFGACDNDNAGTPKPRTYPRVDFPTKEYKTFESPKCNFKFEYPEYAEIVSDTEFFGEKAPNDCWFNLSFKSFNGTLFLTYYPVANKKDFQKLVNDSYDLVSKHDIKASGRKEIPLKLADSGGMLFKIEGNVASQTQFFITDSTNNFIRGALYFNNKVNTDSMQVIQNFVDTDIDHLIKTFGWQK